MALFSGKKVKKVAKTKVQPDKISSATIITSCMKVTGNLDGSDTIHIDGNVVGNITVSNTLVIGKNGLVEGNVEAKHVIINGELQGSIKCENLEVMQAGKVSTSIEATYLILDGVIDGNIIGHESIEVLENSDIHATSLKSKTITVHGKIQGSIIASEILEIGAKGFVEGQITVKNIKTAEGGRMIGTMATYQEETPPSKPAKKEKKKVVKTDDFFSSK